MNDRLSGSRIPTRSREISVRLVNEYLPGAGLGKLDLFVAEDVRISGLVDRDGVGGGANRGNALVTPTSAWRGSRADGARG